MGPQIAISLGRTRPVGIQQDSLPPEVVADAEGLGRPAPRDALAPVMVLRLSYALPIAGDERQDVASNHGSIVAIFSAIVPSGTTRLSGGGLPFLLTN